MIARKTVLILGAGASAHLGFPSGPSLVKRIWKGVSKPGEQLFVLLRGCGFPSALITEFGETLRRSGQPSVDLFLEHRPEFLEVGKTAIAAQLMPFEIEDNLFAGGANWYPYLFKHLGPSLDDVRQSRLSVVTFNYDRSLDWYLFQALKNAFRLPTNEVVARLVNIPIVHVYGQLGALPHQNDKEGRPYRHPDPASVAAEAFEAKKSIEIVSEGVERDAAFNHASRLIEEAAFVSFLGFGYLRENVKRLGFPRRLSGPLWGSAYDVRDGEREVVRALFGSSNEPGIQLGSDSSDVLTFLRHNPILR
jgi:hypothetical protein